MNKCEMSDEQLLDIFTQSAKYETSQDDVVIIIAEVNNDKGLSWRKEVIVEPDDNFTAMQRSTAFSISTVASLMAEGVFDNLSSEKDKHLDGSPNTLTYSDIPFDVFNKCLGNLLNK